jgi:type IV pilus assembly protein PilC
MCIGSWLVFSPGIFVLALVYGWVAFAFLHYRNGRQDELLRLIVTAVKSGTPLPPAIRSYLADRPHGTTREFWVALGQFIVLPGYYWLWHRRHQFDRKVARVADHLEQGLSLSAALRAEPGVAAQETIVAAAVGESTNRLATCLERAHRTSLGPVWVEVVARLSYPLTLLLFIAPMLVFWMVFIGPKMRKIFADFQVPLPSMTANIILFSHWFLSAYALYFLAFVIVITFLVSSPEVRWWTPGLGHWDRAQIQSRVLGLLSVIVETGKPIPDGIRTLIDWGHFSSIAQRRLKLAWHHVEAGGDWVPGLSRYGLLPRAMVPLLQTAEHAHELPWALADLADLLAERTVQSLRRASIVLGPILLLGIGAFVGYMVVGMFIPLVELINQLSE